MNILDKGLAPILGWRRALREDICDGPVSLEAVEKLERVAIRQDRCEVDGALTRPSQEER
jgi:hypothetical protein